LDAYREFDQRLNALNIVGTYVTTPLEVHQQSPAESGPLSAEMGPRFLTTLGASLDEYAALNLARTLMSGDRTILFRGSWLPQRGNEPQLREWLASYQSLPSVRFENAISPKLKRDRSLAAVRYVRDSATLSAYAVNASPWSIQLEVFHRVSATQAQTDRPPVCRWLGPVATPLTLEQGGLRATLAPGALVAWEIADPDAEITGWTAKPLHSERLVTDLRQRLTQLNSQLVDGSFEASTLSPKNADFEDSATSIDGWEGTQHPSSRISLDRDTAASGTQSVLLERSGQEGASRCWIMSPPIEPSIRGRIVISASLKCDPTNCPRLRFGIEGRHRGVLVTRSTELDASQGTHRLGKEWANFRFELGDLPTTDLEQVRVTFDLLTPGKLWVDQVQVSELILTSKERKRMREQIYLAAEGLNEGDVSIAADVLGTDWARHLLEISTSAVAIPPLPLPPKAPPETKTADRFRQWLPRMKR
jgi:hypothetical protein